MRVKIGPYINYFGPYQITDLLKNFGVSEDRAYAIGEWLAKKIPVIEKVCLWINENRKRKIDVRIDYYDVWGLDNTLAHIILPSLKLLKEKKQGSPMVDNEDLPEHLRHNNWASNESLQVDMFECEETNTLIWKSYHTRWDWVLNEMIWAFEQELDDNWEDQFWKVKPKIDFDRYPEDEGKDVIPLRWKTQGECDFEGRRKHQERMNNGFRLFGKYYQGLWS